MNRRSFLATSLLSSAALPFARNEPSSAGAVSPIAQLLGESMIWAPQSVPIPVATTDNPSDPQNIATSGDDLHAVFLHSFELNDTAPQHAHLHLFAYTRYRLYVNSRYAGRGPNRFQNQRPEYDTRDITSLLHRGRNSLAVLVHRDAPTGRIMRHAPGFAAVLELDGRRITTGPQWRSTPELSFGTRPPAWASIREQIDARKMPDWLALDFTGEDWPRSVPVASGPEFAPLHPRAIPLQSETAVELKGIATPTESVRAPFELRIDCGRIAQAFHHFEFDADEGSEIALTYELPEGAESGSSSYIARRGVQTWTGGDTFAVRWLRLKLNSGRFQLKHAAVFEVRYPFEIVGSFQSEDEYLNHLWAMCARSVQVMSEDAYVDCADRERVEWTDETPPAYQCTRVMMAGPDEGGRKRWCDARLEGELLRRIALTQQPDGQIKSHSCSERWDIHGIMEDRSCDWVISTREYVDATGDLALVREVWPAMVRLMDWFLQQRTARGLVQAREWEVWDNPLRYQVCEGAGLNAFIYRALLDAAALGSMIGETSVSAHYATAAGRLRDAFNSLLWNEAAQSYHGALIGVGVKITGPALLKGFNAPVYPPTLHSALFALSFGLVTEERRAAVRKFMLAHQDDAFQVMSHHFLFEQLYALDTEAADTQVLALMRQRWRPQVESPWQTTWETLANNDGSKVHVYGMVPGYWLSAFVLGVQRTDPVSTRRLVIDPRPGDLQGATGIVVTEFGPVPISWTRHTSGLHLDCTVPPGVTATLRIAPYLHGTGKRVTIDGKENGSSTPMLGPGPHRIECL